MAEVIGGFSLGALFLSIGLGSWTFFALFVGLLAVSVVLDWSESHV